KTVTEESFLNNDSISAIGVAKNGKIYIAIGKEIRMYENWKNLLSNASPISLQTFLSKVTSIAIDADEQYLGAGTNKGSVWIIDLKNNGKRWSKPLHLTRVNDLKFAKVEHDKIQLASAGEDQTIKLIDVGSVLQNTSVEDILTLR